MWLALIFSLIGIFASLRVVSESRDPPVFMAAGGLGLLATGLVILVRGMASPHGEAVGWAVAGLALLAAAAMAFSYRAGKSGPQDPGQFRSARTRIRTRDQLIKSQLLYQLSYAGSDKS